MRSSVMVLGLCATLAAACGATDSSDDGLAGGDAAAAQVDAGPRADAGRCQESVDVVLVLDVSSSMDFVLADLEDNISAVVDAANQLSPDAHFGLIAFVDNHKLDDTGASGVVHTTAASLVAAVANYRSVYTANNRNPGDGPNGPTVQNPACEENSLDAMYAAATDYPWREDAARVIIVATDDTFLEAPDNYGDGNGDGDTSDVFPFREGDYPALHTVADTTSALTAARTRVFSFTRLTPPGLLSRCGTGRRLAWDDITDGWTTPYQNQAPFPEVTDGRNYDLQLVQSGSLSLADTISEVVLESYCNPID